MHGILYRLSSHRKGIVMNFKTQLVTVLILVLTSTLIISCGGSSGIIDPDISGSQDQHLTSNYSPSSQVLWGLFDIYADPTDGIQVVPLRGAEFQANVTNFLQPPLVPINLLSVNIDPGLSDFPTGLVVCDLTIQHPFPSTKFWGFDVRGIVMGSPSGEVSLKNHDGYTRWWNPSEFTTFDTLFGYTEGGMAPPGDTPVTILHPYKYFADSLAPEDPMYIEPLTRGAFNPDSPGTVSRRYELQFPTPGGIPDFHFKYAITASWEKPDGDPPWSVSHFPITANQPEAYQVSILDVGSTLYKEGASAGGDLNLQITVFDWQKPFNPLGMTGEMNELLVECLEIGLLPVDILPSAVVTPGPDMNSVCYIVSFEDMVPIAPGFADVLVTAVSANVTTYAPDIDGLTGFDYPDDAPLAAYNILPVTVFDEAPPDEDKTIHVLTPNGGELWEVGTSENITWESTGPIPFVKIEYSLDDTSPFEEISPSTENDGMFEWVIPATPTSMARVRISDAADPLIDDISDAHFLIVSGDNFIYVDNSSTSPDEFGTMADPFKTITSALSIAISESIILVDDSDVVYVESVVMADGVTIQSENWDFADGDDRAEIRTPDIRGASTIFADGVTDATISGFQVHPAGSYDLEYFFWVTMANILNSSNITINNCYFNREEFDYFLTGVNVENSDDIEIGYCHFDHFHGPDPGNQIEYNYGINAVNTPGMYIHNVRMNDFGTNFNSNGHNVDAIFLSYCDDAVLHNNLIYKIVCDSGGDGAALVTGIKLEYCASSIVYNNTVNFLDTVENFFINQAFCYFYRESANGTFYNNIASNVAVSGWAPDGSELGRGIQSYLYDLPCDYTLTWEIAAPYFQQAFPNIGCVDAQPLYFDPENGLHDIGPESEGQMGHPDYVDWDDSGTPSGDPGNPDPDTRSRMGCHGGPNGAIVGIIE